MLCGPGVRMNVNVSRVAGGLWGRSVRVCCSAGSPPPFLPALTCGSTAMGESADGQKRKGARGRFGHELYMESHFKQQPCQHIITPDCVIAEVTDTEN